MAPPFSNLQHPRCFHPPSNESGSKNQPSPNHTPPLPPPFPPIPSSPSFLATNNSHHSSTQSGNLRCILGCPASESHKHFQQKSPSLNMKIGGKRVERERLFIWKRCYELIFPHPFLSCFVEAIT